MADDALWGSEPVEYVATYDQAVRNMVSTQVEPTVRLAGGFDAVRNDPAHPIHEIYDDFAALERDYELIVNSALNELTSTHYQLDPQHGVELTAEACRVIDRHIKAVREPKPILHYRDDPAFDRSSPDELNPHHPHELDPSVYIESRAQAVRFDVLHEIAPDIAGAGGFPGVERNPNHRRHNSPEGLAKVRQQYDAIVERAEHTFHDDAFYHDKEYGWGLRAFAIYELKQIAAEVRKLTPEELAAHRERGRNAYEQETAQKTPHDASAVSRDEFYSRAAQIEADVYKTMIHSTPEGRLRIDTGHEGERLTADTFEDFRSDLMAKVNTAINEEFTTEEGVGVVRVPASERAENPMAQGVQSAQEIRRFLVEQRLGMRTDEYLAALAGSAGRGTSLQEAARHELARREALSAEDHAAEDAIRAREQEVHSRTKDRSLVGSDMSL